MARRSMSLKSKLLSATGAAALVVVILVSITRYFVMEMVQSFDKFAKGDVVHIETIANLSIVFLDLRITLNRLGLSNLTTPEVQTLKARMEKDVVAIETILKTYALLPHDSQEDKMFGAMSEAITSYMEIAREIVPLAFDLANAAQRAEYLAALGAGIRDYAVAYQKSSEELTAYQNDQGAASLARATANERLLLLVSMLVGVGGVALILPAGYFFARSIVATIDGVSNTLQSNAGHLGGTAAGILQASSALSLASTKQASALQETVAAIDEINAMVGRNAENALRSKDVSVISLRGAEDGKRAVDDMINAIREIDQSVTQVAEQTETSNREIGAIIKVIGEIEAKTLIINDIVFQTKLLSFNAAVEAARAGEHGKGFAVVAEEVGNLASLTGSSAKEISDLLASSSARVEAIVRDSRARVERLIVGSKAKVDLGNGTAARCGEVLDDLLRHSLDLAKMTEEIASASREQATGIAEVSHAMAQLDQVTQANAASAENVSGISDEVNLQARQVERSVQSLSFLVNGGVPDAAGGDAAKRTA